jgi:PilZ domain
MSTDPNRLERRGAHRFEVHLPLAVHFEGRTVHGFTQDVSGRGIFFYAETSLPQGAVVEVTFIMPSEITLGENMPVRCRGRVLRSSVSRAAERNGIAVQLDSYQYLPASELISPFVRVSAASASGGTPGPLPS